MSAPRRTRRAGFTLLELMVALTLGGIAITSIYAIGASSTRVFHQQQQVANAQTTLRMALNQIKRDLTRAGFHGTANAAMAGQICGGSVDATLHAAATKLAAISVFENDRAINVGNGNTNVTPGAVVGNVGFTVDDVVLIGNFATSAEYPGVSTVGNSTIAIPTTTQAFRRDFTNWHDPVPALQTDPAAVQAAFAVNRLVRLRLATNLYHFSRITSVTIPLAGSLNPILIELAQPLPPECVATATGAWVAPVGAIRYRVRNPLTTSSVEEARFPEATGPMAQLVREEVWPSDKNTILTINGLQARRPILDYVVAFNLAFTMTGGPQAGVPGQPDAYVVGARPGASSPQTTEDDDLVNLNPERVRAVTVDLAVRTPEQDPTFSGDVNGCAGLRCYRVFDDRPGAARVRRLRTEVYLPNVAKEGY